MPAGAALTNHPKRWQAGIDANGRSWTLTVVQGSHNYLLSFTFEA